MTVTARPEGPSAAIRQLAAAGRFDQAWQLLVPDLLRSDSSAVWSAARNLIAAGARSGWGPPSSRAIRLAILCTYESTELGEHLRVACIALGIGAETYIAPYGQLEQELMSPDSGLARFAPTHVLIAAATADLAFAELAEDPAEALHQAEQRWRTLWDLVRREHGARVIQHTFVVPDETPLGHLSLRLPGSRPSLVRELNRRLAEAAGADVLLIDCERLAGRIGKSRWNDPRLWHAARRPFGQAALPQLARDTAAVIAGDVGLAARCLVVDLDNTLWGGVIGEDGPDEIVVGEGPEGEAYAAFQEYLNALSDRGILLAVASKNDLEAAREPFDRNLAMRLKLDDFAVFVADWRPKSEQIAEIAATLGLGLGSLVFADDNPAECAEVAAAFPEVSTIVLDVPVSERVRLLAASARFETPSLSRDDLARRQSYAARAKASALRTSAATLEDFWRSLEMRARVRELDAASIERAAQLTQKTNQFNLTLNRHSRETIERFARDDCAICMTLELEDRFASHGLIGLAFAVRSEDDPETALIDTLLLSCRVIGRTAEAHLLSHIGRAAQEAGFRRLRGLYVPGPRNALVSDLYPKLGFEPAGSNGNRWEYDLAANGPIESLYIADDE